MPFTSYDAATHAIARSRELLQGSRATGPLTVLNVRTGERSRRQARLPASVRADMRRLSVVMAIAALDTYMHRLVVERVYTHDNLPGGLATLDIAFAELLQQADETASAARRAPHNPRPRVGVKRQLRDRLLRETFQSSHAVSRALGMAGRSGVWQSIAAEMPGSMTSSEVKARLDRIVMRRHQIVHEGDYERLEKPRTAKMHRHTAKEATSDIAFIAALIDAIHAVVSDGRSR